MQAVGTGRLVAGRYRLHGQIGRGAMGIVWRGRDELLDRDVAVKQVRIAAPGSDADGDTAYQRTLREAKTAARLNHPGVVTVFDVVEEDSSPWIVMELVRARSLDQVVAEDGPLRPAEAAGVGERLLSALACAHAAGVLHRDVKPSNVLVTPDGGAVLTDFGIATLEGDPSLTQAGMVVGTPGFTAPERVRGEPATPASDLWSLGATLYAAVEGRGPFDRPGGSAVITAGVINEDAPRAPSAGPLGPVIEALLRTNPGARPDTATAARLLAGVAALAPPGQPDPGGRSPGQAAARLGQAAARLGQAAARQPAAAPPDLLADAATARLIPDGATVPGEIPDLPGSPAFADLHEFPDLSAPAGFAASAELPAFLDLPQPGGPSGLPPGQAAPWAASTPGLPPGDPAPWSQAGPPGGPDNARQPARRRRALGAAAGIAAAAAAAGLIAWTAFPHSVNAAAGPPGPSVPSAQPSAGRVPGGSSGQPGRTTPAGAASSGHAAAGILSGAGSTGTSTASRGQAGGGQAGGGSGPPPIGYRWLSVPAASAGTPAGFEIAVPDGWQVTRQGLAWYLVAPVGSAYIEVSLAPFSYLGPVRQAEYLQAAALRQHAYPGYRLVAMFPASYRGSAAGSWRFSWRQRSLGRVADLELLFSLAAATGRQDYALSVSASALSFPAARAVYAVSLRTFRQLS